MQAERLPGATWHDGLDTLPDLPLVLLANEFLDALPIRQFVRRGERGWSGSWRRGSLSNARAAPSPPSPASREREVTELLSREAGEGWGGGADPIIELQRTRPRHRRHSSAPASPTHPGAALFLDYGPERSAPGDSLQALRDGRPADPLADPGTADLTAHVDFAAFAAAARAAGAAIHGPVAQGLFLARLGLFQRTDRLARTQLARARHPP